MHLKVGSFEFLEFNDSKGLKSSQNRLDMGKKIYSRVILGRACPITLNLLPVANFWPYFYLRIFNLRKGLSYIQIFDNIKVT